MPTSKISWAGAPGQIPEAVNFLTWNCNKVSPGCKHCYAQTHSLKYPQNSAGGQFLGAPLLRENAFEELRLTKPGTVLFVNTHSDTFHESVSFGWIKLMFQHMNQRPDLIFLLLTKRPQIALQHAPNLNWTDNIWLGTSIESQQYYGRLETLVKTPARNKFISFEPLLGAIQPDALLNGVQWIITGAESGENRRPFGLQWAIDIKNFCQRSSIPFYYKQGSSIFPDQNRLMEGREYNERPAQFELLHTQYRVNAEQKPLF
jgi:protein gp37